MTMTELNEINKKDLLLILLRESVDTCYCNDNILIKRGMEQASVARIYYYMQKALEQDERFAKLSQYQLDCEYNKNGQKPKRTPRFKNGTRPDIILHNRMDEPCQDNVLILEFKPKLKNGSDSIPQRDKEKLEDFTDEECIFANPRGCQHIYGQKVKEVVLIIKH